MKSRVGLRVCLFRKLKGDGDPAVSQKRVWNSKTLEWVLMKWRKKVTNDLTTTQNKTETLPFNAIGRCHGRPISNTEGRNSSVLHRQPAERRWYLTWTFTLEECRDFEAGKRTSISEK